MVLLLPKFKHFKARLRDWLQTNACTSHAHISASSPVTAGLHSYTLTQGEPCKHGREPGESTATIFGSTTMLDQLKPLVKLQLELGVETVYLLLERDLPTT